MCVVKQQPTGHIPVESMLITRHFNEIMLNQSGICVELTSVPSGVKPNVIIIIIIMFLYTT